MIDFLLSLLMLGILIALAMFILNVAMFAVIFIATLAADIINKLITAIKGRKQGTKQ